MSIPRLQEFLANHGVEINSSDNLDTELESCDWWDSMAILLTMVGAEQELKISISGDEFLRLETVNDLYGLLFERSSAD